MGLWRAVVRRGPASIGQLARRDELRKSGCCQARADAGYIGGDQLPTVEQYVDVIVTLNCIIKVFQIGKCCRGCVPGDGLIETDPALMSEPQRDFRQQLMMAGGAG